jgi:peptidoglycan hydrolase CwlO-like protein
MDGAELRALTRQRRQLTSAVTQQARSIARDEGLKVTQAVADQVEATLTAAMLDKACARAVRSGLLVAALSTTGVGDTDPSPALAVPEALGFAATSAPEADTGPALRAVPDPDPDETARLRAEEALASAEEALTSAEEAVASAQASVDELEARSPQVQAEIDELKRRLAELETRQEDVDDELSDAEDELAEATSTRDEARRTRDEAAASLR